MAYTSPSSYRQITRVTWGVLLAATLGLIVSTTFGRAVSGAESTSVSHYLAPPNEDLRHPIDVFSVSFAEGDTESDVLRRLPAVIYPTDKVSFLVDPRLGLGTIVQIHRAMPITIQDGKTTVTTRTWANTVEEVLADINRPLVALDRANYSAGTRLEPNMSIAVTRVAKYATTQSEVIPFETITRDDPNVYRPETKVVETGKNGEKVKTYEITREDGEIVSRQLIKTEVTVKPQNKVIAKGTKVKIGKTASGKATWYDLCCKKVAANIFKKGTHLRVTNKTTGKQIEVVVDDTGGFGSDIVIDLHPDYFQQLGGTLGQGIMQNVVVEEILNP